MAKLSRDEQVALAKLVAYPNEMPRWGAADYIAVCSGCSEAAICCTQIGIPRCACGGHVKQAPQMDALLAAYRIGGWAAMVEACRHLLADDTEG